MKLHPLHLVAASLLLSACLITIDDTGTSFGTFSSFSSNGNGPMHVGSGHLGVEKRETEPFHAIISRGSMDVEVTLAPDLAVGKLELRGDDNLLEFLRTEVVDGTLILNLEQGSYRTHKPMLIRVRTAQLVSLALEGSGDTKVEGLVGPEFRVRLEGSGDVQAKGKVERLEVELRGSGDLDLGKLSAKTVSVDLEGSGDIRVHAKQTLDVNITGSGDVGYRGNPVVSLRAVGSGDLYSFD